MLQSRYNRVHIKSKLAEKGLDDAEGVHRDGRVPKQARGGGFGSCEASRRVNPMHHGKVKAKTLDNDEGRNRSITVISLFFCSWISLLYSASLYLCSAVIESLLKKNKQLETLFKFSDCLTEYTKSEDESRRRLFDAYYQ